MAGSGKASNVDDSRWHTAAEFPQDQSPQQLRQHIFRLQEVRQSSRNNKGKKGQTDAKLRSNTHRGARNHDHKVKGLVLYWLS